MPQTALKLADCDRHLAVHTAAHHTAISNGDMDTAASLTEKIDRLLDERLRITNRT